MAACSDTSSPTSSLPPDSSVAISSVSSAKEIDYTKTENSSSSFFESVFPVATIGDNVYFSEDSQTLYAYNKTSNKVEKVYQPASENEIISNLTVIDGALYGVVGQEMPTSSDGTLTVSDKLPKFINILGDDSFKPIELAGSLGRIVTIAEGKIYCSDMSNIITIDLKTGEKETISFQDQGFYFQNVLYGKGYLYFANGGPDYDAKTLYRLPLNDLSYEKMEKWELGGAYSPFYYSNDELYFSEGNIKEGYTDSYYRAAWKESLEPLTFEIPDGATLQGFTPIQNGFIVEYLEGDYLYTAIFNQDQKMKKELYKTLAVVDKSEFEELSYTSVGSGILYQITKIKINGDTVSSETVKTILIDENGNEVELNLPK